MTVAAAFYPLAFAAERVGGDRVEVVDVTPPGVEPHDIELDPDQLDEIQSADVVLYLGGGFQPAIEEAVDGAGGEVVDLLATADPVDDDPHVWLDPVRMEGMVERVADVLAGADPGGRSGYEERAGELADELLRLDDEMEAGLAACSGATLVSAHDAFGYLAERYGLEVEAITGLSPEAEVDPARLAQLADLVAERGVTTVFTEELVPPDVARALADEAGVTTAVLDPIESRTGDGDYLSAMRGDLAALEAGLACP